MAVSRKNNDAPKGVNLDRLPKLVERIEAKKQVSDDARSDLGTIYKEAEDFGFNRPALKLAVKLRNMEVDKRADFLSSLNAYCDKLGVFAQQDLFNEAPTGVGPGNGTEPAEAAAAAQQAGETAGKRGARADSNPHDADTPTHVAWQAGWLKGQAEAVRRNIKPIEPGTETHASA